jgi:phage terminase small subunit
LLYLDLSSKLLDGSLEECFPVADVAAERCLSSQEFRFVEEYLLTKDVLTAYFRAFGGYETALCLAEHVYNLPRVQRAIEVAQNSLNKRLGITAERVVEAYAALAFYDPADMMHTFNVLIPTQDERGNVVQVAVKQDIAKSLSELPPFLRMAIKRYRVKYAKDGAKILEIEYYDRMQALRMLAKHLGMKLGEDKTTDSGEMGTIHALLKQRDEYLARSQSNGIPDR